MEVRSEDDFRDVFGDIERKVSDGQVKVWLKICKCELVKGGDLRSRKERRKDGGKWVGGKTIRKVWEGSWGMNMEKKQR